MRVQANTGAYACQADHGKFKFSEESNLIHLSTLTFGEYSPAGLIFVNRIFSFILLIIHCFQAIDLLVRMKGRCLKSCLSARSSQSGCFSGHH